MTKLDAARGATTRWWARALAASHREPRLASALLDRRGARYALHRLRGFALARGAAAALHVLEASVLLRVLPARTAILAFLATHVSSLVGGLWWGATEQQRIAVRDARDGAEADRITAIWLAWSRRLAGLALVVTAGIAVAWWHRPLTAAYAGVLGLRVASDLPLRVWHARISAHRRIFRRMWMQLAVEATGPGLVLALHGRLGVWGFFVAMAASSVLSRATTWHFIRRAYATARQPWIAPARRPEALPWMQLPAWALAGAATRVPSVLGVVFLAVPGLPLTVAIGLHMTVGALSAAGGWAWSHYQDFVALAQPVHARLRARLERLVVAEAVAVGVVVGAAVLAIVYVAAPRTVDIREPGVAVLIAPQFPDPWPYALALPALTLGFSALAASQVVAWTRGARLAVLASGIAACVALRFAAAIAARTLGHAYAGDYVAASTVRGEHLVMGGALLACALGLALAARVTRAPRDPRLPWRIARARAGEPGVVAIHATAAGDFARVLDAELGKRGATWWSRREHTWLVAGLAPDAQRELGLACAGLIARIEPPPAAPAPAPPRAGWTLRFRFDRAAPRHPQLTEHELHLIWAALQRRLAGVRSSGPVAVLDVELDGEAVVACAAQLRPRTGK